MNGKLINSELTSKIGLVGDARGKIISPGLLARYDENMLLIDELDKMKNDDQNGLLQAMEEGAYTITKGKQSQEFHAEVRVMASCNNLERIQPPLLDRFDFPIRVNRIPRVERADHVSDIIDSFMGKEGKDYAAVVKAYLEWAKKKKTSIDPEDEKQIKEVIRDYILHAEAKIEGMSYRNLEFSLLRIAYALALLEQQKIKKTHVAKAIELKDEILKQFFFSNK
jgi:DNA replicative helicase MCM subunit Mcm2 (Cdc46/Mcm family)